MNYDIRVRTGARVLIDIADFHLPPGRITFLFGESGIGKSLLSRAVYGLLDAEDLEITVNNQNYVHYCQSDTCRDIQKNGFFVFQEPSTHLNPLMTLAEQMREGDLASSDSTFEVVASLLPERSTEQIADLLSVYPKPYRPSGGEKQRVLLAMALIKMSLAGDSPSRVFIFDEPTGSLDDANRNVFLDLLLQHHAKHPSTVLFISHDYSIISQMEKYPPKVKEKVQFLELVKNTHGHELHHFSSKKYTSWLQRSTPPKLDGIDKPLLTMASGLKIFNRHFIFTKEHDPETPVDLEIKPHQLLYLKAGSGVGKTTVAKIMVGLNQAQNLRLKVGDIEINDSTAPKIWPKKIWAKRIGMIFQHADEALNLNARVKDVFNGLPARCRPNPNKLLAELKFFFDEGVGIDFLDQKIRWLSGGQKQRLNIMRTFFLNTDIILLDEPLNGLDFKSMVKIIDIVLAKCQDKKGILLISHNEEIFDRLIAPENRYYLKEQTES